MFEKLYENEIFSTRLNTIKIPTLENYKKEHHLFYDMFANAGYLMGYLIILNMYNLIQSAKKLSIIILVVGLFINISAILLIKSQLEFSKVLNKNEN